MRTFELRVATMKVVPFDLVAERLRRDWRPTLVRALGALDDGVDLHVVGSRDGRGVYGLTLRPGTPRATSRPVSILFDFELRADDRTVALGGARLVLAPASGRRGVTSAGAQVTGRWQMSRLRRQGVLGRGYVDPRDLLTLRVGDYLEALSTPQVDHL